MGVNREQFESYFVVEAELDEPGWNVLQVDRADQVCEICGPMGQVIRVENDGSCIFYNAPRIPPKVLYALSLAIGELF